ncbi:MAG: tetratricopeptide repeat protein [Ignavibacteriales bacterium]|nr:tetratricopeptide repeat protein [Ignavibacteriales bacterium]
MSAQEISPLSFSSVAEEQDYAFAFGLYSDSLFQLAGQQFETFVQKYPKSIKRQDAEFFSAECLFQSAQYQNAAAKYNAFIQNNPNSKYVPEAYLKLGQSSLNLKKNNDAIAALKIVLDKYGESESAGDAAYWIGEASLRNDDTQNALKYYTLAYENYPKNRLREYALYSVAWTLQKRTEYAKAAEQYGKLIAEFPQSSLTPGAHVRIGECFYYAKEYAKAVEALTKSREEIHSEEELANADYLLAEACYKLDDFAEAQKRYEKFLLDYPKNTLVPEVTYNLAWSLFNQKNYSKAIEVFNKLTNRTDDLGHAALYRRGTAERLDGKNAIALKTFEEVVKREPQGEWSDNALFDAGSIFFEETNASGAKPYFQRLTAEFPKSDILPDGYKMLGECLLIEGNFQEAHVWFQKALAAPGASFEVKIEAGFQSAFCAFKLKDFKDAAATFAEFIAHYPKHPKTDEAKFYQAEAEYRLGNYTTATRLYQESAESSGSAKKEEALYGIAWALYKQGKFPQAIESFEKLLVEYPRGKFAFDARLRLGDANFFQKDYKKAVGIYRTVIRMYPDSASIDYAYYQLGQSYLKDGDNTEAYKAFDGLIKTLPHSPLADDAQFALGWVNFQRKEYGEAIKEFNTLLKTYTASELLPRAYYSLGDSYYNIQQYVAAEKSYREVLRQFPKSPYVADATTGIQYCLTALGKDSEAVEALDEFVKDNPTSPVGEELELKKGDLLFNQKKYSDAVAVYRGFADKYPHSQFLANAHYAVAKCYRVQGSPDEAALAFERAANVPSAAEKLIGESLFEAAEIYTVQHKPDKAILTLQNLQGKVNEPEIIAEAKFRTGEILRSLGKNAEADAQFGQVIQEYGDLPIADKARVAQARMYFELQDYDRAKTAAEKVATSRKDETGAEAQYIVGASLAGKKDWSNVITALLRVKYVFPSYERWVGRAYLGLGDAYEQTKDARRARESYLTVLKLKTESSVIEEAQRRLKRMEQQ